MRNFEPLKFERIGTTNVWRLRPEVYFETFEGSEILYIKLYKEDRLWRRFAFNLSKRRIFFLPEWVTQQIQDLSDAEAFYPYIFLKKDEIFDVVFWEIEKGI